MKIKSFAIAMGGVALGICGCATRTSLESIHLESCKELVALHYIYKPNFAPIYYGEYMITPRKPDTNHGVYENAIYKDELLPGTQAEISSIILNKSPGWGNYLRMTVKILDGPHSGLVADVPMCAPYHSPIKWVPHCTLDPNRLQFNPDLVRPCDS